MTAMTEDKSGRDSSSSGLDGIMKTSDNKALLPLLWLNLSRIHLLTKTAVSEFLTQTSMTMAEVIYIVLIAKAGVNGITLKDLTADACYDKAYTTRIITSLTEKGHVVSDKADPGQRKFKVYLTQEGAAMATLILPKINSMYKSVLAEMEPAALTDLKKGLSSMLRIVNQAYDMSKKAHAGRRKQQSC